MALKMHPSLFVHPGPWLKRTYLDHFGMTVTEVATHLGVSRQNMSVLLNGHAGLTALMALRFEKAFGISAETLLRMQAGYDLARARAREGELDVGRMRKVA
jgi:addiction module HigA family antidote